VTVTMRDVARLAGVSTASVCRALATPDHVRADTRERVHRAAARLGYRPNPMARGLTTGRTRSIGLIVPDIANPFFPTIVKGAQARARELGYTVLLADTNEDPRLEVELIRQLDNQVDGFLLCAARAKDEELRSLSTTTPVVTLNRRVGQIPSVTFDNADATRQAVSHLAALGHRRVAYISGPRTSWVNRERVRGMRTAAGEAGVELVAVGNVAPTFEGGAAAADSLLSASVTAAVAYNDLVALGALSRLRALGIGVPAGLSLLGFDDIPMTELVDPPMTTVAGEKQQLGRAGIDLLGSLLGLGQPSGDRHPLPTRLIVRGSTATAPRATRRRAKPPTA
jgi:LacI family transcriptional regulator